MSTITPQTTQTTESEQPQKPKSALPKRAVKITAIICALATIFAVATFIQALLAMNKARSSQAEADSLTEKSQSIEQELKEVEEQIAAAQLKPWCASVTAESASDRSKVEKLLNQLKSLDPTGSNAKKVCADKVDALTTSFEFSRVGASIEEMTIKCETNGNHVTFSGEVKKFNGPKDVPAKFKKATLTLTITSTIEGSTDHPTTQTKIDSISPGETKQWKAEADMPGKVLTCRVSQLSWWPTDLK